MARRKLHVNVGNLLELAGAILAVCGVYLVAGLGFALILAAVLCIAAAEFVYDVHTWHLPLPRKPAPRRRLTELRQATRMRWLRTRARFRRAF